MRCAALALLVLAATPAQAERLKYLTSSDDGTDLSIDVDSVRRMPPLPGKRPFPAIQVWTIYDLSRVRREPAREARALLSFNCQGRTMAILAYTKRRPTGQPIQDWKSIDYDFKYTPAGADSLTAYTLDEVCGFPHPLPPPPPPAPVAPPPPPVSVLPPVKPATGAPPVATTTPPRPVTNLPTPPR